MHNKPFKQVYPKFYNLIHNQGPLLIVLYLLGVLSILFCTNVKKDKYMNRIAIIVLICTFIGYAIYTLIKGKKMKPVIHFNNNIIPNNGANAMPSNRANNGKKEKGSKHDNTKTWLIILIVCILFDVFIQKYALAMEVVILLGMVICYEITNLYYNADNFINEPSTNTKWMHGSKCWEIGIGIWIPYIFIQAPPKNGLSEIIQILGIASLIALIVYFTSNVQHNTVPNEKMSNGSASIAIGERLITNLVIIYAGTFVIGALMKILKLEHSVSKNQESINKILKLGAVSKIWMALVAVVVAPIIEETTFRLLMIGPKKYHNFIYANRHRLIMLIISIFAFGLGHMYSQIPQYIGYLASADWKGVFKITLEMAQYAWTGTVLGLDYYKHSDIRSTMLTHAIYNGAAMLVLIA